MAVKQYSRKMTIQLALVVFLGWVFLLIWAVGQWVLHDYSYAFVHVTKLVDSQREAISPVYQGSILSALPIETHFQWSLDHPYLAKLSFNELTADLVTKSQQFIKIMILASQCMLIKLMILLAAMPLFALAMIAGLVDGLNQRAIRTACLGRESSYVFHRLNHYFKKGLVIVLLVWLAMPISITPAYVFIPISLLLALMVAMTASRFKKYL
ncbi:TIGR03747 family integrating conjugative element membrane protein [Legionella israelensis]|uniref:TIGR03747 family integrating conjugative element membrane protein n=1 Tax=Legionella israelensis TaxID=454 RepID=A0AAX1EIP9_9GAMM|nr:TIGR03747 family integrating conjugative element membrane protein [Legionella israelensis]QBR84684.1 TIGR03747 family integrating conjugative element membrane protein [Legionella israelensis]